MKAQELRTKSVEELKKLLGEAEIELNDNRRSQAAGELPNTRVVSKSRKAVARLHTMITQVSQSQVKEASKGDA